MGALKPKLRKKVCAAGGTAIYIQGRVELALKKGTKYAIVRKDGPVPEGAELTEAKRERWGQWLQDSLQQLTEQLPKPPSKPSRSDS